MTALGNAKKLAEHEEYYICNRCDGTGIDPEPVNTPIIKTNMPLCRKCWGDGIVDWIENVVGKQPVSLSSSTSSCSSTCVSSNHDHHNHHHIPTQKAVKQYMNALKQYEKKVERRNNEFNHNIRNRTFQRFRKMFNKS